MPHIQLEMTPIALKCKGNANDILDDPVIFLNLRQQFVWRYRKMV